MKLLLLFFFLIAFSRAESPPRGTQIEYRSDAKWKLSWDFESTIDLEIDTKGYSYPTSITFISEPGVRPNDPLYFVTEIRGKIKVITNERKVYTFAENFFKLVPREELPSVQGEVGLASVCLAPEKGYLFATFTYQDEKNILRNGVARFESRPKVFGLKGSNIKLFLDIFKNDETTISHQMGPCQVKDGFVYVNTGDAERPYEAQDFNSSLGKVLRFDFEGKAPKENPFFIDNKKDEVQDYIFSYGYRNAFGSKFIDNQYIVAENGPAVDRVHLVNKGQNSQWDGTDWSISTNSLLTFRPTISPVQIDYLNNSSFFTPKEYENSLLIAAAGSTSGANPAGVLVSSYSAKEKRVSSPARYIIKYTGKSFQNVTGIGVGHDAIYFTPLYPLENGETAVVKVKFKQGVDWEPLLPDLEAFKLMNHHGCLGCHQYFSMGTTLAPNLTWNKLGPRLNKRLNTEKYIKGLDEIDSFQREPFTSYKKARDEVREAKGMERVKVWVKYHIMQPRFDVQESAMPELGIPENQASLLAEFLVPNYSILDRLKLKLQSNSFDWKVFCLGLLSAFLLIFAIAFVRRLFKRK